MVKKVVGMKPFGKFSRGAGRETPRNTGTGTCFVEKEIELQAEMSVAQFFL